MFHKKRVLIIEDTPSIADSVAYTLKKYGYTVECAYDGEKGLSLFRTFAPDIVILDIGLPGIHGLQLLRIFRDENPTTPIIMATCFTDIEDRVSALELGADDYVTKPFSTKELTARVGAVLRRANGANAPQQAKDIVIGNLTVSPANYRAEYGGRRLLCSKYEFLLLAALAKTPQATYTRDQLLTIVYGQDANVTDRVIDQLVKHLRRKFADGGSACDPIETVYGIGYKLNELLENGE